MTATRPRPVPAQAQAADPDLSPIWRAMGWFRRDVDSGDTQEGHISAGHIWIGTDAGESALDRALAVEDYFERNQLIDRLAAGMSPSQARRSTRTYTDAERLIIYMHHLGLPHAIQYVQAYPATQETPLADEELQEVVRAVFPRVGA